MLEKIGLGILIFIITFWTVIFMVLPFKYEPDENVIKGNNPSSPKNPNFKMKLLLTFILSLILTPIIMKIADYGLESLASTKWDI